MGYQAAIPAPTPGYVTPMTATAAERLAFLRKVYSLFFAGIAVFFAGAIAFIENDALRTAVGGVFTSFWWYLGFIIGGGYLLHAVRKVQGLNLGAFFAYAFAFGMFLSGFLFFWVTGGGQDYGVIWQGLGLTLGAFGGLTAYVFLTRKDFSFLGGILGPISGVVVAFIVLNVIFGFSLGSGFAFLFSLGLVVLMSGWVLFHTSRLLREHPIDEPIVAAVELLSDFAIMLFYIVRLLSLSRD